MKRDELERLGGRYGLTEGQRTQLATILAELARDERAPTTVRDPGEAVEVHLADSLVALELAALGGREKGAGPADREGGAGPARLVDLGAGAGFPGMALAVALPGSEVRLLESQARKCAFIERVCGAAGIENARVVWARAEEWREGIGASDVVTARALAAQAVVLEYAAPLLRLGGALVDWRGRRDAEEEARAARAGVELGMELAEMRRVEPYAAAREHHLHVFRKVRETPARFPRRAGVARKRPLGC